MQLTLYREEVNMKKVNQWSDQEVTPLVINLHDTDSITDQTLDGVRAELTQQGWNKTQAVYAEMIVKLFGKDILVKDVKTAHVDALQKHLRAKGRTDATINRYNSALSKMLKYAWHRKDVYEMKEFPHIKWHTEDNARLRWVTPKEEKQMVKAMSSDKRKPYLDFFMFLMDTGLRKGEALKLTKGDIRYDEISKITYILVLDTKNGTNRNVPLTKRARAIVEPLVDGKEDGDVVFNYNYWTLQHQWDDMREIMGLEEDKEFTLHALRHTYASRLAQSGQVDFHRIAVLMGHKTLAMTKRYSHLMPQHTFGVVDILDNDRQEAKEDNVESLIDEKSHNG